MKKILTILLSCLMVATLGTVSVCAEAVSQETRNDLTGLTVVWPSLTFADTSYGNDYQSYIEGSFSGTGRVYVRDYAHSESGYTAAKDNDGLAWSLKFTYDSTSGDPGTHHVTVDVYASNRMRVSASGYESDTYGTEQSIGSMVYSYTIVPRNLADDFDLCVNCTGGYTYGYLATLLQTHSVPDKVKADLNAHAISTITYEYNGETKTIDSVDYSTNVRKSDINAGTYTLSVSGTIDPAYSGKYTFSTKSLGFTVNPKDVSAPTSLSTPYTGSEINVNTLLDTGLSASGSVTGKDVESYSGITITATNGNYNMTGTPTTSWSITSASGTWNWSTSGTSVVYGTSLPTASFSGVVAADSASAIMSYSGTEKAGETVVATASVSGKSFAGNYSNVTDTKTFSITKADITSTNVIAPEANTLTYSGSGQTLISAGSVSGLAKKADNTAATKNMKYAVTSTSGSVPADTEFTYSNSGLPKATNAGTYYVWYKVDATDNYNAYTSTSGQPIVVTIAPDSMDSEVKAPTAKSLTYNSEDQALINKGSVTGLGTAADDAAATTNMKYALTTTKDAVPSASGFKYTNSDLPQAKDAGTYYVWYKVDATDNYEGYPSASGRYVEVTIAKKTVDVTWSDITKTYNGSEQTPTYSTSGIVDSGVTVSVSGKTDVGNYTATAVLSGSGSENYQIEHADSNFYITAKKLTISWSGLSHEYDGTTYTPTASLSGLVGTDTESASGVMAVISGSGKDANTYTATASLSGTKSSNYVFETPSEATKSFTITKKVATLSWSGTALTYTGSAQAPTATVSNLVTGDTCTVTVTGGETNVGDYTATASSLSNSNYALPSANTTAFTISPASITAPANSSVSGAYTGSVITNGYTTPDHVTVTGSTSGTTVGTYTATYDLTDKTNYVWSDSTSGAKTVTLTITKRQIAAPSVSGTITYDGSVHEAKYYATLPAGVSVSGTVGSGSGVGSYSTVYKLDDEANNEWATGSASGTRTYTLNIIALTPQIVENETRTTVYVNQSQHLTIAIDVDKDVSVANGMKVEYKASTSGVYKTLDPSEYTVTKGSTVITLNDKGMKHFEVDKNYDFKISYASGNIKTIEISNIKVRNYVAPSDGGSTTTTKKVVNTSVK